jgi:hypothetical protein
MPAVAQPTEAATRIAVFMMAGSRVVTEMDMDRARGDGDGK